MTERNDIHKYSIFSFQSSILRQWPVSAPAALDGQSRQMFVGKLQLIEFKILSLPSKQLFMDTLFDNPTIADNNDAVGIADGG